MKFLAITIGALAIASTATAATPPATQVSTAIMRQADDFYIEQLGSPDNEYWYMNQIYRNITSARCRGKSVFVCTVAVQRQGLDPPLNVRVLAKTRKAGGFCWAIPPTPIPSGCLAPGKRAEGNIDDIDNAVVASMAVRQALPQFRATAHGSGFYSWYWFTGGVEHRGTVVFSPAPKVKVLS